MVANSDLGKIMEGYLVEADKGIEEAKTMAGEKKLTSTVLSLGISKGYSGAAIDIFARISTEAMTSLNPSLLSDIQALAKKLGDVLEKQKEVQEELTKPSNRVSWII